MTIEEKAQRYDDAINAIKELKAKHPTALVIKDWIKENFPELAESEDEKIRKALIDGFTVMKESKNCGKTFSNHNIPVTDILAWLEKQGKQKPVEWSEEDEKMLNQIISIIENADDNLVRPENISIYTNWLKSKVQPQLKWKPSELQIEALESATANCAYGEYEDCLKELIKQLKQL